MIICPFLIYWGIREFESNDDPSIPADPHWQASVVSNIVGWDCTSCSARFATVWQEYLKENRESYPWTNDGVVWLRVCGSSGNNEMLAGIWESTQTSQLLSFFSVLKETHRTLFQSCVFNRETPALQVLEGKVRIYLYIFFTFKNS